MHGSRNLPPTGGMREMFERKWLMMGFHELSGLTGPEGKI
jgi:hypothetical protein